MPSFRYRAAAAAGGTRVGEVEATDLDQAIGRVRDLGLVPMSKVIVREYEPSAELVGDI